ncbi:MAG: GDSL-type esterase/lipase family protein [Deltaproteobacteria bacterium]
MPRLVGSSWRWHRRTPYGAALLLWTACNVSLWHNRSGGDPASVPSMSEGVPDSELAPPSPSVAVPSGAATSGAVALPDPALGPASAAGEPPEGSAALGEIAAGAPERASVTAAPATGESGATPLPSVFPPYVPHPDDDLPSEVELEGVQNLDYYYGKLLSSELGVKGAITRASLWGDSVIGGDGLTEAIRQPLQRRFGDAGHGFHALGKYSRWYSHRGVRYKERREWDTCLIIFKCEKDRRYGYGGVSSTSGGRALSMWGTVDEELGRNLSRFELWYQKRPDGGGFEIRVDGRIARVVDSRAAVVDDDVERVQFEDGEHEIEVAALGTGVARGYGVVLERDTPGVVWDELSLIGSFIQRLDYEDPEHIAGQVRRRDVDLLAFMFGGNDLSREHSDLKTTMLPYEAEYTRVLRKFRAGKPQASCLILSMTDHAIKRDDVIVSRPAVARLVAAQRTVALAEGCAFFDVYAAMGGAGAIAKGRQQKPPLASPDLRHPTVAGQRRIGSLFYAALMHGYASFRRAHAGEALPALASSSADD